MVLVILLPFLYSCNGDSFSVEPGASVADVADVPPPPPNVLEIGDELDGGIYAGEISGYQLIATPGNCTNSTTPVCDGNTDSELINRLWDFSGAYCSDMNYGGFSDWYYPNLAELTQLYNHRVAIGGFDETAHYWSREDGWQSDYSDQYWKTLNFSDGSDDEFPEWGGDRPVRCVRQQPI